MEPKRLHPGAILENGATLEDGALFPFEGGAMSGAELRTMKQLQGWSRFGSTFPPVTFLWGLYISHLDI